MPTDTYMIFYRMWSNLALDGSCDAAGSVEYQRVLAEWMTQLPQYTKEFILKKANERRPVTLRKVSQVWYTEEQHALVKEAATASGRPMTRFAIDAAVKEAKRLLEQHAKGGTHDELE